MFKTKYRKALEHLDNKIALYENMKLKSTYSEEIFESYSLMAFALKELRNEFIKGIGE